MSDADNTDPPDVRHWLIDEPEPDGWPEDVAFLRHCSASLNTSLTECAAEEQVTAGVSDEAIGRYLDGLEGCQSHDSSIYGFLPSSAQLLSSQKTEKPESDY